MRGPRDWAGWFVGVSLVAGCSAAPGPSPGPSPLPGQGPLEAYVGVAASVEDAAGWVEHMRRSATWTAACMARQGFEYYPAIPAAEDIDVADGPQPGSREFTERYGYGAWIEVDEYGGGFGYAEPPNPEERAYLSSLSQGAREAYETALWGEIVSEMGGVTHREGGCAETAGEGIPSDPFLRSVREEAEEFLLSIPQDPALSGLDEEWSVCMAGEGMSLRSPHEVRESFMRDALAYLADGDHGGIDPFATPHALERAEEEKRVALADLECRELVGYDHRYTEIEHELQAAYVEAHRADLEALLAALDER